MAAQRKAKGNGRGRAFWTAVDMAAAFAAKSDKLTTAEKRELTALRRKKARTAADNARYLYLVRKGAWPEQLPAVPWPSGPGTNNSDPPPAVGKPRDVDPLDRLAKAADLRERGVIDDEEFARLKQQILGQFE